MTAEYEAFIPGVPAPKGSKTLMRGIMRESSRLLPAWNAALDEVIAWDKEPLDGALGIHHTFYMPRPKGHFRPDGTLKPPSPAWHSVKPDYDKLERAVNDGLTRNGVIKDDARISCGSSRKLYGGGPGEHPVGCVTRIWRLSAGDA